MSIKSYQNDGKQLWEVRVKTRDRNGKQVCRKKRSITSLTQAKKIETQLKMELQAIRTGSKCYRWNEWAHRCLKQMTLQYKGSTIANYECNLRKWINPHLTNMWLHKISPHDIHEVIYGQKEMSPSTKKALLKQLKRLFNMALQEGVIERNPCLGISVKVPQSKKLVLNHTEIEKLLAEAKKSNHPFYNHWVMAVLTGMRSGELFALTWTDIDFENKIISVNKSWNRFNGVGPTKSSLNRIVPISKELEVFLKKLKASSETDHVLARPREWIVGSQASILRKFCEEIGITPVKFHDLRATFITQLLLKGVPVAKVMAIVGHADLKTTMHYIRLVGADVMGITDILGINLPSNYENLGNVLSFQS